MLEKASVAHFLTEIELDSSEHLFHYTSPSSLRAILETGNIRLNTLDNMNDPREKKTWTPRHLVLAEGEMTIESLAKADAIHAEPDRLLREGARIACFTHERPQRKNADPSSLFHRGWARARMWETYGETYSGACLAFDYEVLAPTLFDALPVALGNVHAINKVNYQDRALDIPLEGSFDTVEAIREALDDLTGSGHAVSDLFFTKNTDWESEDEVRVLVLLWSPDGPPDPAPLDLSYGSTLQAVVLGENFSDAEGWLKAALTSRQVEKENVLRVAWVDGAPVLRPFEETLSRLI